MSELSGRKVMSYLSSRLSTEPFIFHFCYQGGGSKFERENGGMK